MKYKDFLLALALAGSGGGSGGGGGGGSSNILTVNLISDDPEDPFFTADKTAKEMWEADAVVFNFFGTKIPCSFASYYEWDSFYEFQFEVPAYDIKGYMWADADAEYPTGEFVEVIGTITCVYDAANNSYVFQREANVIYQSLQMGDPRVNILDSQHNPIGTTRIVNAREETVGSDTTYSFYFYDGGQLNLVQASVDGWPITPSGGPA